MRSASTFVAVVAVVAVLGAAPRDAAACPGQDPVDPYQLCVALAKIVGDRKRDALDRATALERCEQLRSERLESFVRYLRQPGDVNWRALAAACRR